MSQDKIEMQLKLLSERFDNLDTIVTTLVERVMKQPATMEVTCPKCGTIVQITFTCNTKSGGKADS